MNTANSENTDNDKSPATTASATRDDFIDRLAAALKRLGGREAVLLAPSRRVGRQWLDRLALRTGSVAGVRLTTLARLMLDSADEELKRKGQRPMRREEALYLVGTSFSRIRPDQGEGGYFTRLEPGVDVVGTILSALDDLDDSGVDASRLGRALASREKADELVLLHGHFHQARRRSGLAGSADVTAASLQGLGHHAEQLPILLVPTSIQESARPNERRFLNAWPSDRFVPIPEDTGTEPLDIRFHTADCIRNEARSVIRFIVQNRVPLDRAEIVCVDVDGYLPALLAAFEEVFPGDVGELPVTCHGGIPVECTRPARLLSAWLEWLAGDIQPLGLARMLWSGLIREEWRSGGAPGVEAERLAAHILTLPINSGPEEWQKVLGQTRDDDAMRAAKKWIGKLLQDILPLTEDGTALALTNPTEVLRAGTALLTHCADAVTKADAYAKKSLREIIAAWQPWCEWPGFDAVSWLGTVVGTTRVMGLGPLPGRVHIAGILDGGHSGREWTFILGLDDSRFPGGSRQDPVLLDKERLHLSRQLEPSGRSRRRREDAMRRLLGRLDGTVVLSHSLRDGPSGRALYPAGLFSRLKRERKPVDAACEDATVTVDQSRIGVLRPQAKDCSVTRRDDWLFVLLQADANALGPADLGLWHLPLAAGAAAEQARKKDALTEYDGFVPEAGRQFLDGSRPVSPSNLEEFARCPSDFFFRTVLGAKPPERFEPSPGVWLQANERGTLLHDVFQDFLTRLAEEKMLVGPNTLSECRAHLGELLERHINRWHRRRPPRDDLAFRRETDQLLEACVIFLAVEQRRQTTCHPQAFEAAIGGAPEDIPPWRRVTPVTLTLPSGKTLTLRGRVDRVDRVEADGSLEILDYKTGSGDKYSRRNPFQGGRRLQPFLYVEMLDRALKEAGFPAPVRGFSYYFPMPRDEGKILTYSREQLAVRGWDILEMLADMLSAGYFPLSGKEDDIRFSDYRALYGAAGDACRSAHRKAEGNELLTEWLVMRKE